MSYVLEILPIMLQGLLTTIKLFFLTAVISIPLGMVIAALRLSKVKIFQWITQLYILIMRGTPLLLQLIFIYFGLPIVGINFQSRELAALIAFSLNYAAYFAEIYRGGFISIPQGQYEAAHVLGVSKKDTFFGIILPQLIKRVLPSVGNEIITLVKDTSLVYVLGLDDMLKMAKSLTNQDVTLVPMIVAAVIYLIFIAVVTQILKIIEQKQNYYRG